MGLCWRGALHQTAYVNEMVRVLKPGGKLAVATWCQRESTGGAAPLTQEDRENLQFLYDEWAHPMFIPYEEYGRIMERTGLMEDVSVRTPAPPPLLESPPLSFLVL